MLIHRRSSQFLCRSVVSRRRLASLLDFGKERLEILGTSIFILGQPRLQQTLEAKSAAHTQHAATMRALVRFMRAKRISEAEEVHLRKVKSQRASGRWRHRTSTTFHREGAASPKARRPSRPDAMSNALPCISTSTEAEGQSSEKPAQKEKIYKATRSSFPSSVQSGRVASLSAQIDAKESRVPCGLSH